MIKKIGWFFIILSVLLACFVVSKRLHVSAPDFRACHTTKEKKEAFFAYMLPLAQKSNHHVLAQRRKLLFLQKKRHLTKQEKRWLTRVAKQYALDPSIVLQNIQPLLDRVDMVPTSLILAQAANESSWGTSKFARLGHNYFGQWCFTPRCGMVPSQRASHKHHEVQTFASPYDSVRAYLLNINTNNHYALLRSIRADLRKKHKTLRGDLLAMGLTSYSERGQDYIHDIQAMISVNKLERDDVG
ncbi:MAG: glucosaminidase domain-containing protein [Legionellaceae bacterium]|nr:glucosaminidase domain-containing protein [Legionellaceae bacterium]